MSCKGVSIASRKGAPEDKTVRHTSLVDINTHPRGHQVHFTIGRSMDINNCPEGGRQPEDYANIFKMIKKSHELDQTVYTVCNQFVSARDLNPYM